MSQVEPRDEHLVERIRRGDAAAAQTLFDRHLASLRTRVQRRLPRVLRGKVGASDLTQDAWLAAFNRLDDFEDRGEGSFARWIQGIVDHKVVDEVRRFVGAEKRDARRETPLATTPTSGAAVLRASDPSPSGAMMAAERALGLRKGISGLPEAHREILRLVHDEGLTLVAAGARMGRSADAARKLYGRALAGLTERLSDGERTRS